MGRVSWRSLNNRIVSCDRCPRLRAHCRHTAIRKRAGFSDWQYWGKPVPNLGDAGAAMLIVGLAPAAHGANRTGRMFTGDRSGDFLYAALYRCGFASQPQAVNADDGLELIDVAITAAVHCAPPANKPTRDEFDNCFEHMDQTFACMPRLRVVLCLGKLATDVVLKLYQQRGWIEKRSSYPFAHGAKHQIADTPTILCSYHPSQQNTFTGRLTETMMIAVLRRARRIISK